MSTTTILLWATIIVGIFDSIITKVRLRDVETELQAFKIEAREGAATVLQQAREINKLLKDKL